MDLLQAFITPQDAAYRTSELERFVPSSSQTSIAAPSSSASQFFSSQQQPMSSQASSVSHQNMPNALNPLSAMERPPSCGQETNRIPTFGQKPDLSVQTLPFHSNMQQQTQDENRMPRMSGIEQGFRYYGQSSSPHDNLEHSVDDFSDATCPLQVQSMEEWENANPDTRGLKLVPATVPRSTGEWKTKLQHLCDQHGIRPKFDYKEISNQRFVATLTVGGGRFETTTPQPRKKLAQEEACKLALAEKPLLAKLEGIDGAGRKGQKRKSEDAGLRDRSEEWIGMINNHYLQSKCDPPNYEDSNVEGTQRFLSKLTIAQRPNEPFTVVGMGHKSKKDARSEVAKAAVLWLRGEGILSNPADKERRTSSETSAMVKSEDTTNAKSFAEQVHHLVLELRLKAPKFDLRRSFLRSAQPLDDSSRFYDIHAEFDERDFIIEPSLRGRKGEVKHCLGQKRAKEECCALIIRGLEAIRLKRLASL